MGQFAGWMLGWTLVLEYTVAAAVVAQGLSQYLNEFLGLFGARIPRIIALPPMAFNDITNTISYSGSVLDLPALLVTLLLTALLVCGVRDSARFNNAMVALKVCIVLFVIILGSTLVHTDNFTPFAPFGYLGISLFGQPLPGQKHPEGGRHGAAGMLAGSALVFFSSAPT
jgi:APA family basic amino acid/polyamine antiporter